MILHTKWPILKEPYSSSFIQTDLDQTSHKTTQPDLGLRQTAENFSCHTGTLMDYIKIYQVKSVPLARKPPHLLGWCPGEHDEEGGEEHEYEFQDPPPGTRTRRLDRLTRATRTAHFLAQTTEHHKYYEK